MTNDAALDETDFERSQRIQRQQNKRIDRLGVAFVYQLGTCSLVLIAALMGLTDIMAPIFFLAFVFLNTTAFYFVIRNDYNLKFKDPSLTIFQILLHYIPPLLVMYDMDSGHARAAFVVMSLVPTSFGVFLLNTRQFLFVGCFLLSFYAVLMVTLYITRPEVIDTANDILLSFSLLLTVVEISFIGGYITSLRHRLKKQNEELNQALVTIKEMANKDALTGIYNRRYLFLFLEEQVARAIRDGTPLSLCLLDVDNFKSINELYGHQRGDVVLQRIAETVTTGIKKGECFGRYGGEEFLLVLPESNLKLAKLKAQHIQQLLSNLHFPEIGADFKISVSMGLAEHQHREDIKATIDRADLALFEAKSKGQNFCVTKEFYPEDG